MFLNPDKNLAQLGLREGMRLADFGSGVGFYIKSASLRVGTTGRVYAIEIQKDLLTTLEADVLRAGVTNVECIWGDVERKGGSKLADNSMDRVILSNVLFQVEDKLGLVDEVKRVLKHDGKVLLIDWNDSYSGMGPSSESIVPEEAARRLFEERGFKLDERISTTAHHYGIIFEHESR